LSLGEAELLLLLSCNSWGGGGGLICSASLEVAEAVAVLLQISSNVQDNQGKLLIFVNAMSDSSSKIGDDFRN
jgi:hypothetical protein